VDSNSDTDSDSESPTPALNTNSAPFDPSRIGPGTGGNLNGSFVEGNTASNMDQEKEHMSLSSDTDETPEDYFSENKKSTNIPEQQQQVNKEAEFSSITMGGLVVPLNSQ
jgi:hypothetical protein